MASRAIPAGSKCCCPQRPFLLRGPSALLCCTGCVLSAWFGGCRPCAFFYLPCHHSTGFSTLPLPSFSTSSHLPWPFPSPVNAYKVSHSVSTCLRHMYGLLPARSPSTLTHRNQGPLPLCSLSCADVVTLCRIFHYGLKLAGLRPN